MKKALFAAALLALIAWPGFETETVAQDLKPIELLKPQTEAGKPLMQVLKERRSTRSFGSEKLPAQMLSNLLWAAFGINREDSGKRTAPSALNRQEIDIYAATSDGLYLYEAKTHALTPVVGKDLRALTGTQSYVKEAAVNLVYVADFSKMGTTADEEKMFLAAADTSFISENVYLFCASEGLGTVVRASIDKPALARAMGLKENQRIIFAQSVGYPKKE